MRAMKRLVNFLTKHPKATKKDVMAGLKLSPSGAFSTLKRAVEQGYAERDESERQYTWSATDKAVTGRATKARPAAAIPDKGHIGLAKRKRKASPARSKKTAEVIYVLSNEAMEGLLKIGRTEDLKERMERLYNTSVPTRFDCVCAIRVDDAKDIEKNLHRAFKHARVRPKREFFRLDAEDIVPLLQRLGEDVTPPPNSPDAHGAGMTPTEAKYERRARRILQHKRGPSLRLSELGILPGETLSADRRGSHEECVFVRGDFRDDIVKFRNKETTFTEATKQLLDNPPWQPRPARHWRHKGRSLVDIYDETYSTKKRRK